MKRCKLCEVPYDPEEGPVCECEERIKHWEAQERYKDEYRERYDGKGVERDTNRLQGRKQRAD